MKKLATLSILLALAAGATPAPSEAQSRENRNAWRELAESSDQLVLLPDGPAGRSMRGLTPTLKSSLEVAGLGSGVQFVGLRYDGGVIVKLPQRLPVAELQGRIDKIDRKAAGLREIEVDLPIAPFAFTPADPQKNLSWGLNVSPTGIDAANGWQKTFGGGSVIGVLDTGVLKHPDLFGPISPMAAKVAAPPTLGGTLTTPTLMMASSFLLTGSNNIYGYDFWANDPDPQDPGDWTSPLQCDSTWPGFPSSWHGTHVSGIAAAQTNNQGSLGATPHAKVLAVRVMGTCGGNTSQLANGIIWASGGSVPGVPMVTKPADVINLSLGGKAPCTPSLQNAINLAVGRGSTIIVAAGNKAEDASLYSPANCGNVITVAAHDSAGNRAWFSNFGSVVDVAAPGVSIYSTYNSGTTTPGAYNYAYQQGTSMSAPFVSSIAAAISSARPDLKPATIESIIRGQTKPFVGSCPQCGTGYASFGQAMTDALARPLPGVMHELYPFNNETIATAQTSVGSAPALTSFLFKGSVGPIGVGGDMRDYLAIPLPAGRWVHAVQAEIGQVNKPAVEIVSASGAVLSSAFNQGSAHYGKASYFNATGSAMTVYLRVRPLVMGSVTPYGVIVRY